MISPEEPKESRVLEQPQVDEASLGDIAARLFELQGEKARLEGEGATAKELKTIEAEIAPLQAFVDEHEEEYARLEMPREKTRVVDKRMVEQAELIERTRAAVARADARRAESEAKQAELISRTKAAVAREEARRAAKKAKIDVMVAEGIAESEARAKAPKKAVPSFGLEETAPQEPETEEALAELEMISPEERTEAEMAKERGLIERTRGLVKAKKIEQETAEADRIAAEFRAKLETRQRLAAEARRELAAAMEARSETAAPPPENLPVAEEKPRPTVAEAQRATQKALEDFKAGVDRSTQEAIARSTAAYDAVQRKVREERARLRSPEATAGMIEAKIKNYRGLTEQGRKGMRRVIEKASAGAGLSVREAAMVSEQYPDWAPSDFAKLMEAMNAEDAEKRFFSQGEKPEVLAEREEAIERYSSRGMTPDQAVAANRELKLKSAREFGNENDFMTAFVKAVEKDPAARLNREKAEVYAEQYWELLKKENARLAQAMEPPPKVGFFRRLFGGAPKSKEVMTAQEVIQFQKMDKLVREIMEIPSTSVRSIRTRGPQSPSRPWTSGRTGRPG